ncbi:MAG: hypothetical protein HGB05_20605 [Chloroflexi bacterium]|nr:hypothetical protein [Chloroflexota bacterium]
MMTKSKVDYIRTVWVPVLHGCECEAALNTACRLASDVVLVGVVYVPPGQPLSAGAYEARQVRRKLRMRARIPGGQTLQREFCAHNYDRLS